MLRVYDFDKTILTGLHRLPRDILTKRPVLLMKLPGCCTTRPAGPTGQDPLQRGAVLALLGDFRAENEALVEAFWAREGAASRPGTWPRRGGRPHHLGGALLLEPICRTGRAPDLFPGRTSHAAAPTAAVGKGAPLPGGGVWGSLRILLRFPGGRPHGRHSFKGVQGAGGSDIGLAGSVTGETMAVCPIVSANAGSPFSDLIPGDEREGLHFV